MLTTSTFHFSVPGPCHEDWDKMSPEEKGRHCAVCKKVVRDFTKESEEEIRRSFIENNGKLCGRFLPAQLAANNFSYQLSRSHFRQLRNFCFALILTFSATLCSFKTARAENLVHRMKEKCLQYADTLVQNDSVLTISGKILDAVTKEEVPFANVVLLDSGAIISKTQADINGQYKITANKKQITVATLLTLKVISVGYAATEEKKVFEKGVVSATLNIELHPETFILGEMYVDEPIKSPPIDPLYPNHRTITREEYNRMPH